MPLISYYTFSLFVAKRLYNGRNYQFLLTLVNHAKDTKQLTAFSASRYSALWLPDIIVTVRDQSRYEANASVIIPWKAFPSGLKPKQITEA